MSRAGRRLLLLFAASLVVVCGVAAQASMRFEVASVRPHASTGDDPSSRQFLPGGRFVATGTSARTLVRIAMATEDDRIVGLPGWADRLFDISAVTADHTAPATPEQFQQVILSLLQEHFGLRYHREQKEGPIYRLELRKPGVLGPGLKESAPDEKPNVSNSSSGLRAEMRVANEPMSGIAAMLQRQAGRRVEDHTGLKGKYSFAIEWSPRDTEDAALPPLVTVMEGQLGLRLRSAKGMVETVIVDQLEQPGVD